MEMTHPHLCLDTNTYSAIGKGNNDAKNIISSAIKIYFPIIVIAELKSGFKLGSREKRDIFELEAFMQIAHSSILQISEKTVLHYVHVISLLRKKGKNIPTNDIWIAAICLEHGVPLYTLDRHFDHIDGLLLIK